MKKTSPLKYLRVPAIAVLLLLLHGCQKEIIEPKVAHAIYPDPAIESLPLYTQPGFSDTYPEFPITDDRVSVPSTYYISSPAINTWLPAATSSVTYNSIIYNPGPFQAKVSSISVSTIAITVHRTDGYYFPANSVIKIKVGTPGGGAVATMTVTSSTSSTYTLTFPETNVWGNSTSSNYDGNVKIYVATWFNPVSGYNFYSSAFSSSSPAGTALRIIAMPNGWGNSMGPPPDGVPVYSNGYGDFLGTTYLKDSYGEQNQCVSFIRRYYSMVYGKNIYNNIGGNADSYWLNNAAHLLPTKKINGASGNGAPQHGDVICFKKGSFYHVGIVYSISPTYVRVFHQNVGVSNILSNNTPNPYGYCYPYKDFQISNVGTTYTLNGSSLSSSPGWSCVGWVR